MSFSFNLPPPNVLGPLLASGGAPDAAPPSGVAVPGDGTALLTPQALLAYCAESIDSVDSQMQDIFNQTQSMTSLVNDVQTLANNVGTYAQNGVTSQSDLENLESQFAAAINAAGGPTTTIGAELVSAAKNLDPNVTFPNSFLSSSSVMAATTSTSASSDDVANAAKALSDTANDIGSDQQLDMIKLQSLMSQQQTAVQMCTNLVQSLGQIDQDIAANIGKA